MRGSLKIARIAGIDIGIHYSWIFAFFIIGSILALGNFVDLRPQWLSWVAGFSAAILLFISVLLHEMAHSLVAQKRGLPVTSITLFIFGGVSNLSREPEEPGQEFIMAIVGPLTSLALAGVFWALSFLPKDGKSFGSLLVSYMALINVSLAAFNLLPGFPLDGGRVLRSVLWKTSGSLQKATNIASIVGQIFGWAFVAFGVAWFFWQRDFVGAIWIGIIGLFLNSAARNSRSQTAIQEHLAGVRVRQVMESNTDSVDAGLPVAELVRDVFLTQRRRAIPVTEGGRVIGMVSIPEVRALPQDRWEITPVGHVTRREALAVSPEDDLDAALRKMAQYRLEQVPVLSEGRLVGILTRDSIFAFLQLRRELGFRSGRDARRSAGPTFISPQ
jgi:Zn-dependent protease/CBS domain-containing protein